MAGPGLSGASPGGRPATPLAAQTDDEATVVMDRPSLDEIEQALSARSAAAGAAAPSSGADQAGIGAGGPGVEAAGPWYVGIEGKPVGPVDPAYLAAQINASRVTAASLVWREGMSDWQPLNTFEELRTLLSNRQQPVGAAAAAVSDPVVLTRIKPQSGASGGAAIGEASAAPGVTDTVQQVGTAGSGQVLMAPSAARAAAAVAAGLDTPAPLSGGAVPPAARITTPEPLPGLGSETPPDSIDLAQLGIRKKRDRRRRKRGMHPMAWAFVAMAASFGGVAAYVLLATSSGGDTLAGPATSLDTSAGLQGADAAAPTPSAAPTAIELAQVDVTADHGKSSSGSGAANGTAPSATASSSHKRHGSHDCTPDDPFCGQSGVTGPSTGSSGGTGSESGRGLTPGQAQATVNRNRHAVSRKCMGYVSGKGGSAKVFVTIKIAPSGSVQSAAVSGGKDYPGLASCVRNRVRNWRFPHAGASTTVNVSFNFIAQ